MSHERQPRAEIRVARTDAILDVRNSIGKSIQREIPTRARFAYGRLEGALAAGVDITHPLFVKAEMDTIREAVPFFSAFLQRGMVNRLFDEMIETDQEKFDSSRSFVLFPRYNEESEGQGEPSALDVLDVWPEELIESFRDVDNKARSKILEETVTPDELSRIGLSPKDFYTPLTLKDSTRFTLPTKIPGVYFRCDDYLFNPDVRLEIVMDPLTV